MVKTNLIRAQMALNGYTITKLAKEIGVSSKTLSVKLGKYPEKFTQEEMSNIIRTLKIDNPEQIFFAQ